MNKPVNTISVPLVLGLLSVTMAASFVLMAVEFESSSIPSFIPIELYIAVVMIPLYEKFPALVFSLVFAYLAGLSRGWRTQAAYYHSWGRPGGAGRFGPQANDPRIGDRS